MSNDGHAYIANATQQSPHIEWCGCLMPSLIRGLPVISTVGQSYVAPPGVFMKQLFVSLFSLKCLKSHEGCVTDSQAHFNVTTLKKCMAYLVCAVDIHRWHVKLSAVMRWHWKPVQESKQHTVL